MAEQVYQPRNPKASPLWRCVSHAHFEEFLQVYSERYQPRYGVLRDVIPEVVEKFLECGGPGPRLRPHPVRSLQGGPPVGLLLQPPPSCHQKRSSSSGPCWPRASSIRCRTGICVRHPQDAPPILPLRPRFAQRPLGARPRVPDRVSGGIEPGLPEGVPGIVMAVHTFGEYLDFHPHLHALVADGLFARFGVFHVMPETDLEPLEELFRAK